MNRDIVAITTYSRQPITSTLKQEQQTQSTKGDYSLKGWQELSVKLACRADHWISSNSCNLPIPTDNAFYCILVLDTEIGKMSSHGKEYCMYSMSYKIILSAWHVVVCEILIQNKPKLNLMTKMKIHWEGFFIYLQT